MRFLFSAAGALADEAGVAAWSAGGGRAIAIAAGGVGGGAESGAVPRATPVRE